MKERSGTNKGFVWLSGAILAVLGFVLTELSILAATRLFGIVRSTLLRVVFTIPLSWLAVYLASNAKIGSKARRWVLEKQERLSKTAKLAVAGGKFFVIINTALFLGPIIASILMVMAGINVKRVYLYAVLCAFLSAWLWSCFYGGLCWGFDRFFA